MLSLVRSGPESLVLHATDKVGEIKKYLNEWGSLVSLDPEKALGIYGNNRRLIFFISSSDLLTEEEEEETRRGVDGRGEKNSRSSLGSASRRGEVCFCGGGGGNGIRRAQAL